MSTRRKFAVAAAAIIALVVAVGPSPINDGGYGRQTTVQVSTPVSSSAAPAMATVVSPIPSTAAVSTSSSPVPSLAPMSTTTPSATEEASSVSSPASAESIFEDVSAPADVTSFRIRLEGAEVGVLTEVPVNGIVIPPHVQVVPPEPDGSNWMDTSVWPRYGLFPTAPAQGTTFVYAHACQHHECPFTAIAQKADGSYTVHLGDHIVITTLTGELTYEVCAVGSSPKSGDLQVPSDCQYQPAVVLVTCRYDGDVSDFNIVVAAIPLGSRSF